MHLDHSEPQPRHLGPDHREATGGAWWWKEVLTRSQGLEEAQAGSTLTFGL